MKLNKLVLACIFAVMSTVSAQAFSKQRHYHKSPSDYDTNGDYQVTPEEILAARAAKFSTIDTNSDLSITLDEFKAWMARKETDRFDGLDADHSKSLSSEEFLANRREKKLALFTEVFALADSDGNGELSPPWISDPVNPTAPPVAGEFAVFGPQPGHVLFRFAALDADGDSKISQEEFLAAPWHRRHH